MVECSPEVRNTDTKIRSVSVHEDNTLLLPLDEINKMKPYCYTGMKELQLMAGGKHAPALQGSGKGFNSGEEKNLIMFRGRFEQPFFHSCSDRNTAGFETPRASLLKKGSAYSAPIRLPKYLSLLRTYSKTDRFFGLSINCDL